MFNYRPFKHSYNAILHSLLLVKQHKLIEWVYQQMLIDGHWGDKPLAARNLLNHMKEMGFDPSVLHFTTLIDGLSRAENLDACKNFFDEMIKHECLPDVVCYTLEKAQGVFDEMITNGQLLNVFTYNAMICGVCMAGKLEEACFMLKDMESRGCNPNFTVYSTLVSYLQNAGKLAEALEVITHMMEKGQCVHQLSKFKGYRRS
ncbi:PREDICTED: pentatricopeptide [Prunus dulcis]|uniref:PREDICTED: pentatricopeptide n=1 Tax=Prunus dulcis TaxID=3755 RepID=A0A5E4FP21_PRUDU|nr:PREDICTED: pentatricopeptide [Prunus dulcis]